MHFYFNKLITNIAIPPIFSKRSYSDNDLWELLDNDLEDPPEMDEIPYTSRHVAMLTAALVGFFTLPTRAEFTSCLFRFGSLAAGVRAPNPGSGQKGYLLIFQCCAYTLSMKLGAPFYKQKALAYKFLEMYTCVSVEISGYFYKAIFRNIHISNVFPGISTCCKAICLVVMPILNTLRSNLHEKESSTFLQGY